MSPRKHSYAFFTLSWAFVLWPASPAMFATAQAVQEQSQMRQRATRAAAGPIKLDVQPDAASAPIHSKVSLRVLLRNAENQPATWDHPSTVNLEIAFPSKRVERQTVVIPQGQNFGVTTFVASEYGIAHLRVTESTNSLLPAGNTVFIVGPSSKPAKSRAKKPTPHGTSLQEFFRAPHVRPRLTFASWNSSSSPEAYVLEPQEPAAASAAATSPVAPPATPQLLLVNSTGKDEILADGKDFARVSVYYMAPNGKGAPSDILLWMSWSNGTFNPQPMIIHRGEFAAEGRLVSSSPAEAKIFIASSAPSVPVQGSSTMKIYFSPPIYGFGPAI